MDSNLVYAYITYTFTTNMLMYFLKMVPSMDPLPFKVFLGYMDYPTEANYVAMTQMPLQGSTQGNKYVCVVWRYDFVFFFNLLQIFLCVCVCMTQRRDTHGCLTLNI